MKVTIVPVVNGAFGTITKGLLNGFEDLEVGGQVETIQNDSITENGQKTEESWTLEETCNHSNSSKKPSDNTDVRNSKRVNNNYNDI